MALQNRVTPCGEIVACSARGAWMGNRGGVLHRCDQTLTNRRWVTKAWITCRLAFKGRHRQVMMPGRYTELFFLDEATSFAAGHRPCAECRRRDFDQFREFWAQVFGISGRAYVSEIDTVLHCQRLGEGRTKRFHIARLGDLPDGAFVFVDNQPCLVAGDSLWRWHLGGYESIDVLNHDTMTTLITPPSLVQVMKAGYRPQTALNRRPPT